MDVNWFKQQQKRAGVTAEEIAREMGRSRTNVSHIYAGNQKMSLEWAEAFAKVLNVPLDEVLKRAGSLKSTPPRPITPGMAEGDAAPWQGPPSEKAKNEATAATLGGGKPGIDVWTVQNNAMILGGYLPGDKFLLDTNQSERVKPGDVVIAQKYDWQTGTAVTVLRRFDPPVLVAANTDPNDQRVLVVDGQNVVVKGKVIASWR